MKIIHVILAFLCNNAYAYEYIDFRQRDSVGNCDLFSGAWIYDPSYPLYQYQQCPFISHEYNCRKNGRPDSDYEKWRWQPHGCSIPRFNASAMLESLRGKKLMFVGDSISQNQFESNVCLLYSASPNNIIADTNSSITASWKSPEYDASIEFSWSPFLVEISNSSGNRILRVDAIDHKANNWLEADILVFESSKWWPPHLGAQRWDLVMEGDQTYKDMDPIVAYTKALTTWARWISENINPLSKLVFFRGTTFSHYINHNGCKDERKPDEDLTYEPPIHSRILGQVLDGIDFPVHVLDVTRSTAYRKDGHPSIYGLAGEGNRGDCTHWCLPGVPESWNHLFYVYLSSLGQSRV